MILYGLICEKEHQFDSWFRNSSVVEKLVKAGQVACPKCGSVKVQKALQAPNITPSKKKAKAPRVNTPAPEAPASSSSNANVAQAVEKMTEAYNELREAIEKNFDNVGDQFAEEARKIHYGEAPERGIYGDATPEQTEELHEEGIPVYALPWPKKKRKPS
ncbi:MAG: DUF1178 family protein [Rhodospirillaceae bacterium]|nr:DUF1178 family protein [Rhodospirillaceae bacterium]